MLKRTITILYIVAAVVMAAATFVEKYNGTEYTSVHIYGSWWFAAIWALLAATAIAYIIKRRMRRPLLIMLHAAFVIILIGAMTTHLTATKGVAHLRVNQPTNQYTILNNDGDTVTATLPFTLRLDSFAVNYYHGTMSEQNYQSEISIIDGAAQERATVSMNNIHQYSNYRLMQNSYDNDHRGTYLSINSDPYGIGITYTGYALLFISLLWLLVDPSGTFRKLLRSPLLRKGALSLVLFVSSIGAVNAQSVVYQKSADRMGEALVLYNGRICPLETYAQDLVKKVYGDKSYHGLSAMQVLTGWMFWGNEWQNETMIRIKSSELRKKLSLPKYMSMNQLMSGGYILGPYIRDYYNGNHDALHKAANDVDELMQLIIGLRQAEPFKMFPITTRNQTQWYGPQDKLRALSQTDIATARKTMQTIFSGYYEAARILDWGAFDAITNQLVNYQQANGGASLPSSASLSAEHIYNKVPFTTILFIICLTMGFLTLGVFIRAIVKGRTVSRLMSTIGYAILGAAFVTLTFVEVLRWLISGTIPMANGYETMLLIAWMTMLITLICYLKFRITLTFGFLLSGFFLLVSHISQMDPQITNTMPVLRSPLLSVHVSIIMMAFALLSLTFICAVVALLIRAISKKPVVEEQESLMILSRLFLYPAIVCLGFGIFIGAIWANISWGQYWSWDPKEVWALITMMVYAAALHSNSYPKLRQPVIYHTFMIVAFLTILMTYFGVNYFLGGMHSYA